MKVCLIRPPFVTPVRSVYAIGSYGISQGPSIGLALIAGALEKSGHHVTAVDCLGEGLDTFRKVSKYGMVLNGLSADEMVERIPKDTEIFGVTMMFSMEWFYYETILLKLKEKFPHVPIIAGGEHLSAEFRNLYKVNRCIDYCVIGEGDETVVELLDAFESKKPIESIRGIAFLKEGELVVTPRRERVKKIDELALPLWEKFPIRNYLHARCSQTVTNRRSMPILASRGCPFACTFCSNKDMWGTELYLRSPKLVVEEIKVLKAKYDIEHLDFSDPVGVLNRKWIVELLTELRDAELDVTWLHGAGTRSEILDDEVLTLFKESGAQKVNYAPETGSKELIKKMRKSVNLEKITYSMKLAIKKGLVVKTHIMYGVPGQTLKHVFESMLFSFKLAWLGADDVNIHIFSAHPGTKDFRDLVESGKIPMDRIIQEGRYAEFLLLQSYGNMSGLKSWSGSIPNWIMPFLQWGTYLGHYGIFYALRPWLLVLGIKRAVIDGKPVRALENVFFRIFAGKTRVPFKELEEISISA